MDEFASMSRTRGWSMSSGMIDLDAEDDEWDLGNVGDDCLMSFNDNVPSLDAGPSMDDDLGALLSRSLAEDAQSFGLPQSSPVAADMQVPPSSSSASVSSSSSASLYGSAGLMTATTSSTATSPCRGLPPQDGWPGSSSFQGRSVPRGGDFFSDDDVPAHSYVSVTEANPRGMTAMNQQFLQEQHSDASSSSFSSSSSGLPYGKRFRSSSSSSFSSGMGDEPRVKRARCDSLFMDATLPRAMEEDAADHDRHHRRHRHQRGEGVAAPLSPLSEDHVSVSTLSTDDADANHSSLLTDEEGEFGLFGTGKVASPPGPHGDTLHFAAQAEASPMPETASGSSKWISTVGTSELNVNCKNRRSSSSSSSWTSTSLELPPAAWMMSTKTTSSSSTIGDNGIPMACSMKPSQSVFPFECDSETASRDSLQDAAATADPASSSSPHRVPQRSSSNNSNKCVRSGRNGRVSTRRAAQVARAKFSHLGGSPSPAWRDVRHKNSSEDTSQSFSSFDSLSSSTRCPNSFPDLSRSAHKVAVSERLKEVCRSIKACNVARPRNGALPLSQLAHQLESRQPCEEEEEDDVVADGGNTKFVGAYTTAQRRDRIARFCAARERRVWSKRVNYTVRKKLASGRLRYKGRFVRKIEDVPPKDRARVLAAAGFPPA